MTSLTQIHHSRSDGCVQSWPSGRSAKAVCFRFEREPNTEAGNTHLGARDAAR